MKLAVSKVLVGIDGSDHSFRAAQYALEISKKYVAKLIAVTVTYMPAKSRMSQQEAIEVGAGLSEMDKAKTWFESFTQSARENKIDLKTELVNSQRPVDYVILEYAEKEGIDLIVIGTRGRSGLSKIVLGSVASRIVTYSHFPVLVVK
ncbi:MAG: universal stress protein [Nitrososphaeraceae archaeon]|jgi:nucleotide-binding universal stress UspA family protein